MKGAIIDSLDVRTWLQSLGTLASEASDGDASQQDRLAQILCQLVFAAPEPCKSILMPATPRARLDDLLAGGASESAVIRLIQDNFGLLVSFPIGAESALASVTFSGSSQEYSADAKTLTLAVITAVSVAIFERFEEMDEVETGNWLH